MIPEQREQGLNVIPKNQYKKLMELFDNIYSDWIIDQDDNRRKNFLMFYNIIRKEVENLFRNNNFWIIYSMNSKYCEHVYKKGIMKNMICNKRIDIICDNNDGKYKCHKHISKVIYHSDKRKNMNKEKFCTGIRKYGTQLKPCGRYKTHGNYCFYHKPYELNIETIYFKEYINYLDSVDDFNDYYSNYINIYIYEKEVKKLLQIEEDIFNYELFLICDTENCQNKTEPNEYCCYDCIEEQKSIYEYTIIDNEITYYVNNLLDIEYDLENNYCIDNNLNYIDDIIKNNKNNFIKINDLTKKIEKTLNSPIDDNIGFINSNNQKTDINNTLDYLDEHSYINIKCLYNTLYNYRNDFRKLKEEIFLDFPRYKIKLEGYYNILEDYINKNIETNINMARINSKLFYF